MSGQANTSNNAPTPQQSGSTDDIAPDARIGGELSSAEEIALHRAHVGPLDPLSDDGNIAPAPPTSNIQREESLKRDNATPPHRPLSKKNLEVQHGPSVDSMATIAAATAAEDAVASHDDHQHRAKLRLLVDKIRHPSRSRSRSPAAAKSPSLSPRLSGKISRHNQDTNEATDDYQSIMCEQEKYNAKLKVEEEKLGFRENADGLLQPKPEKHHRG
ncbi:hypothetical protein BGZ99_005197, partial [Dissophora globulifera]